ncbi:MAG: class I SAM-dependent methyltransferase [Chitinophagaceae bacterium]
MNNLNLTLAAIRNLKQVGSLVPSSHFLVRRIIREIDFSGQVKILELGAGNGVITKGLLNQMSDNSILYSYENNASLITLLEGIEDNRLIVKGESVSNLNALEDNYFDVVISSLPLANLNNRFKYNIYKDVRSKLKESGTFIQYQYLLSDYKRIERYFRNCHLGFCLLNIPPAFIYKIDMTRNEHSL